MLSNSAARVGGVLSSGARSSAIEITVLIVDDFPLVRQGIAAALEVDPGIRVVGEAGTAAEALELAPELRPDVVVLDLRLPDGNGIKLIEQLRAEVDGVSVLVVTAIERTDSLLGAAAAGASGYLTKRADPQELRNAVVTAYGGGTVFESSVAADLVRGYPGVSPGEPGAAKTLLTVREKQILALVADGRTDKEIAAQLALSVRTVQNHLTAIRRKTEITRRAELASWAVRHALD